MHRREPVKRSPPQRSSPTRGRRLPAALLLLATACTPGSAHRRPDPFLAASKTLEADLLSAVREAGFKHVLDGKRGGVRIEHPPNVDLALIELDPEGRPLAVANVLLSRDYPEGVGVPVDRTTLGTTEVRFTRWDLERWDGQKAWAGEPGQNHIIPGREKARLHFMAPYPASLFKLLIAYRVMRLVDQGELKLNEPYRFIRDKDDKGERPVWGWLEPMVVESDNTSTEALVKLLHERGWMEGLNAELAELGLGTLQVNGTSPVTGRSWSPGNIHMTALDTARLLLLIEGGPGTLWRTPAGKEVTAGELSRSSRAVLKELLAGQGLHEALSSTVLCGDERAKPGIPSAVPARWLDASTGTATVAGYWRRPEESAKALEGGWLHTGELAQRDSEGCFRIVGRVKDLIISGGENIYPSEVESVLSGHPEVAEVCVIGVPDPKWGETPRALVVRRPGSALSSESLLAYCDGRLARYKTPRSARFVESLPRTAAGKVDRRALASVHGTP